MSAHHHVTLGAKGVGQPAVTLGYVAVQKGLGTRNISEDGDEQKSMTPVKKINNNKQVPTSCCHQGQSPHEPGTGQRGCVGLVPPVPRHRGPVVCLVNRQGVGQGPRDSNVCQSVPCYPALCRNSDTRDCPWDWCYQKDEDSQVLFLGAFSISCSPSSSPKPGTLAWRVQHGQHPWVQLCSSHRNSTVAVCWQGPGCMPPSAYCHLGLL